MKKLFNITALFLLVALVFGSCKKLENQVVFSGGTSPVLAASSTTSLILTRPNQDNNAISFSWTNPNYQFNTGVSSQDVTYTLQIDTTGANFTNPKRGEKSISKDLATTLTVKDLNTILSVMELKEDIPHNLEFRIKSSLANGSATLFSNVIKVIVTPYFDVVYPVPTKLYITGSASPASWMSGGDPELVNQRFTKVSSSKFELTIALSANNSYLFVPVYGDWSNKYGFAPAAGTTLGNNDNNTAGDDFKPNGNDMKAPANSGTYKITVDFKTGKWSIQ
jgi:starch-binding outer membrane protein SusE/F